MQILKLHKTGMIRVFALLRTWLQSTPVVVLVGAAFEETAQRSTWVIARWTRLKKQQMRLREDIVHTSASCDFHFYYMGQDI